MINSYSAAQPYAGANVSFKSKLVPNSYLESAYKDMEFLIENSKNNSENLNTAKYFTHFIKKILFDGEQFKVKIIRQLVGNYRISNHALMINDVAYYTKESTRKSTNGQDLYTFLKTIMTKDEKGNSIYKDCIREAKAAEIDAGKDNFDLNRTSERLEKYKNIIFARCKYNKETAPKS